MRYSHKLRIIADRVNIRNAIAPNMRYVETLPIGGNETVNPEGVISSLNFEFGGMFEYSRIGAFSVIVVYYGFSPDKV